MENLIKEAKKKFKVGQWVDYSELIEEHGEDKFITHTSCVTDELNDKIYMDGVLIYHKGEWAKVINPMDSVKFVAILVIVAITGVALFGVGF